MERIMTNKRDDAAIAFAHTFFPESCDWRQRKGAIIGYVEATIIRDEEVGKLLSALKMIAAHEPTKGLVKVMPMTAVVEMHRIATEALRESGGAG
jgi:hypothetical protein